jgi:ketosteroid isomerase-like protein
VADGRFDEARTAFAEALQLGDALAASALYADDARLLAPSAELFEGREAIAAFWRAGIESGITQVELESLAVEERGDVAHEIGRYLLRLAPDEGDAVVDRGKYLLVHERQQDGSWRWAVEMFNPEGSPALRPGTHMPELRKGREQ